MDDRIDYDPGGSVCPAHFVLGDHVRGEEQSLMPLVEKVPTLKPGRLDQIAALPLGARVLMDPWSNRLDLNHAPAVPLY